MTNTPKPLPWERQPDETDPAWIAFTTYRDLPRGERSLSRLASEMQGDDTATQRRREANPENQRKLYGRWSSVHHWQDRIIAYDNEIDRRTRGVQLDEVLKARRRHAQYAQTLMEAGIGPAIELIKRIQDQSLVLAELSAGDLYKLTVAFSRVFPALANTERVSRGEPAVELETPIVPSDLQVTDEHLIELWAVMEEMGVAPHPPSTATPDDAPVIPPPESP